MVPVDGNGPDVVVERPHPLHRITQNDEVEGVGEELVQTPGEMTGDEADIRPALQCRRHIARFLGAQDLAVAEGGRERPGDADAAGARHMQMQDRHHLTICRRALTLP